MTLVKDVMEYEEMPAKQYNKPVGKAKAAPKTTTKKKTTPITAKSIYKAAKRDHKEAIKKLKAVRKQAKADIKKHELLMKQAKLTYKLNK